MALSGELPFQFIRSIAPATGPWFFSIHVPTTLPIESIQHSDEVEERFPGNALCNLGVIHALQIGDQPRPRRIPAQILPRLFA
jgi:hypothetical protein